MAHYRGQDNKREQFRRYLEQAGVVESLTSVLLSLYEQPEKPSNALEFVRQQFGATGTTCEDTAKLQHEVIDLRQKCARLTEENKDLKAKLQRYESVLQDGANAN
ncbi:c-Myc-binding protein-like [Betta splendens]|uniref:c-Myc-binding protein-like n=1 Tax=Betta splendens TaxID=158456 RepID=A0A6P7KPG5_BETSP|nr:c-Myc-binding protein-like [Betta splendens]